MMLQKNEIQTIFILSLIVISMGIAGIIYGSSETAKAQPNQVTPPRNLIGYSDNQNIYLDWEEPSQGSQLVESYKIYRGLEGETNDFYTSVSSSTLAYTDQSVIPGRTYTYHVTAEYNQDETNPSNEVTVQVDGSSPPTSPRELDAFPGDAQIQLDWQRPFDDGGEDISRYNIYRGVTQDGLSYIDSVDAPQTSYLDQNVQNGQIYYYHVKAHNDIGDSDPSNIASAEPREGIVTPSHPRDLKAYSSNGRVELYWDPPSNADETNIMYYQIYRGREGWNWGDQTPRATSKDSSFIDTQVVNNEEYVYTVTAVNANGESLRSNEVRGTPSYAGIPDITTSLNAEGKEGKVEVSWNQPAGDTVTGYVLYRGTSDENISFLKEIDGGSQTEYEDKDVDADTTYYYRVRAVSDGMIGERTNPVDASPQEKEGADEGLPWTIIILALLVLVALFGIALWKKQKQRRPSRGEDHEWKHQEGGSQEEPPAPEESAEGEQGPPSKISDEGEIETSGEDDWG